MSDQPATTTAPAPVYDSEAAFQAVKRALQLQVRGREMTLRGLRIELEAVSAAADNPRRTIADPAAEHIGTLLAKIRTEETELTATARCLELISRCAPE
jgi:hypothetical protein